MRVVSRARCVESYREHLDAYARMTVLQRWYERIDTDDLLGTIRMKKRRQESGADRD